MNNVATKLSKLSHHFSPSANLTPSNARLVSRICLVYLGVNLIGWWLAKELSVDRPLFNLDYLVAGLVYVWISRSLAAVLCVALFVMEFVRNMIPIFFFTEQAFSLQFWARCAAQWPLVNLLLAASATIVLLALLVVLFGRYRLSFSNKAAATTLLLGLLILLIAADWLNGTSSVRPGQTNFLPYNLAGSPAYPIARNTWATMTGKPARLTPIKLTESATGHYFSKLLSATNTEAGLEQLLVSLPAVVHDARLPDKIVLILVESLSALAADPNLENWRQIFHSVSNRYTIESGHFEWMGATMRGEIRELCWQSLDGLRIESLPATLPSVLKSLNYEVTAFHGFHATMYARDQLYPLLGFDHSVFLDDMRKNGQMTLVGTLFRGAPDTYVASLVHDEILRPGKRFLYWVTLSGHIPVNVPYARDIATPEELKNTNQLPLPVWANTVICRQALESIADIAADPSLANCDFIIVSDHSIPVIGPDLKKYYLHNRVPYLILRHRQPAALP